MFGLWGSGPSTPKRHSTLKSSAPLTPKLTTPSTSEYPPQLAAQHDAQQWEHVKHGGSPSSLDIEDDATYERLGYSQVAQAPALGGGANGQSYQQEMERIRGEVETLQAAVRKAEGERDRWERKVVHLQAGLYKDGSGRTRRDRERERDKERDAADPSVVGVADAFKEENEALKGMLQQRTQELDGMRKELEEAHTRYKTDVERLKSELDMARATTKEEVDKFKASVQEHGQRIERLTADCDRIRRERESIRTRLNAEIERLKATNAKETEQFKSAFEEVNRDRSQAHADVMKTKKSLDACAAKLDECLRQNETLRFDLSYTKDNQRKVAELEHYLKIQDKELVTARHESSTLKKEFQKMETLLEDRTSELKGAQSFLSTADTFSGAEVTNTLQRLNAEVLQSTAYMAESMVEQFFTEPKSQASKTSEQAAACERTSVVIGPAIVGFLGTKKHKDDPILIQIAFQACLAYHLCWIACAWIIGGDEGHNRFINVIYNSVHEKEAQAIAGRWRALTRAHVPPTTLDDSQLAFQIATRMISGFCDILLAAGCTTPKSSISSALSSKFADKLSFLVSLAMRVNKIVGEDVTSGDFEVLAIAPGDVFDGAMMEDSYDDGVVRGKGDDASKVLCATDLGLRKKTRVGMTGEKQWETKVLLKPKVALESIVEIMDE